MTFVHQEVGPPKLLSSTQSLESILFHPSRKGNVLCSHFPVGARSHPRLGPSLLCLRGLGSHQAMLCRGLCLPSQLSPGNLFCSPMFALLFSRHNTYLQECTGQREPTYQLNIHDLKLLFLRFAMEQSFSADTGGGGRESNIHLIPYIIHTVLYVLNTSVSQPRGQRPAGPPVPLCPTRSPLLGSRGLCLWTVSYPEGSRNWARPDHQTSLASTALSLPLLMGLGALG